MSQGIARTSVVYVLIPQLGKASCNSGLSHNSSSSTYPRLASEPAPSSGRGSILFPNPNLIHKSITITTCKPYENSLLSQPFSLLSVFLGLSASSVPTMPQISLATWVSLEANTNGIPDTMDFLAVIKSLEMT